MFVGSSFNDYEMNNVRDLDTTPMFQADFQSHFVLFYSDRSELYHRTACSFSMVALHQACQSLRRGECSMAVVASCHLIILPDFLVTMSMLRHVKVTLYC